MKIQNIFQEDKVIEISKARQNLSSLVDDVFINHKSYIITKRNIPLARLIVANSGQKKPKKEKKIDMSLFGFMKNNKKDSKEIADEWRKNSWRAL